MTVHVRNERSQLYEAISFPLIFERARNHKSLKRSGVLLPCPKELYIKKKIRNGAPNVHIHYNPEAPGHFVPENTADTRLVSGL